MATGDAMDKLVAALGGSPAEMSGVGNEGLCEIATHPDVDLVLCASSGTAGLDAVLAAIEAGKTIALANKEVLVMAGGIVMDAARRKGVAVLPVDSEHNAIHQCLHARHPGELRRLILTASGGPFRGRAAQSLLSVTAEEALKHPTWQMGPKITIDSATLMNKGLEIIEAKWLFDVDPDRVRVIIHPQSILHSAVEFVDGSVIGQMGLPDMRLPIHYALFWPERVPSHLVPSLDLMKLAGLSFEEPDLERFPCLAMARRVAVREDTLPSVLNAANEVVVEKFLAGTIQFSEIPSCIETVLERHNPVSQPCLDDIVEADQWARRTCQDTLGAAVTGSV
jgi:1-deoxy-D-xylulose-5-phosphate reductoisomerase